MRATSEWIDGQLQIPELLRAAPQVRPVLDRYGLTGFAGHFPRLWFSASRQSVAAANDGAARHGRLDVTAPRRDG